MSRSPGSLMSLGCRCPWVSLLVLASAGTACAPFKADPSGDGDASRPTARRDGLDAATDDPSDATMGDASDATVGNASDAGAQCWHKGPPSRPTVVDAGGVLDLLFAVSEISNRLSDGGQVAYKDIGFDLDDTCTGEGQDASCVEPPWATADHTDGVGGVDNAWEKAWPGAWPLLTDTPRAILRLRDYSGQPDDDQVRVSMYLGRGLAPRPGDGDGGSDGGSGPLWDGHDRFNVMPELLAPSAVPSLDEPLYTDDHAYVSDWTLVANYPKGLFSPELAQAPYELLQGGSSITAGVLTKVGGQWVLQDVVIGARVRINDLMTGFAKLPDSPDPSIMVCQDPAQYLMYQQYYCSFVDIAFSPGPPSAPCDSLSLGWLVQAKQVQFGEILLPTPAPALSCAPGIDPENHPCETAED